MKATSILPLFTSYYQSIFDPSEREYDYEFERLQDEGKTDEEAEAILDKWNYPAAYLAISQDVVDGFEELIRETFPELDFSAKFLKLNRPREYNFETDRIECEFEFKADELRKLLLKHAEVLEAIFRRHFYSQRRLLFILLTQLVELGKR